MFKKLNHDINIQYFILGLSSEFIKKKNFKYYIVDGLLTSHINEQKNE